MNGPLVDRRAVSRVSSRESCIFLLCNGLGKLNVAWHDEDVTIINDRQYVLPR